MRPQFLHEKTKISVLTVPSFTISPNPSFSFSHDFVFISSILKNAHHQGDGPRWLSQLITLAKVFLDLAQLVFQLRSIFVYARILTMRAKIPYKKKSISGYTSLNLSDSYFHTIAQWLRPQHINNNTPHQWDGRRSLSLLITLLRCLIGRSLIGACATSKGSPTRTKCARSKGFPPSNFNFLPLC